MGLIRIKNLLLLIGVVWASGLSCLTKAEQEVYNDGSLPPMSLKRGCSVNADCGLNEFCGGRAAIKRCIDCFDCSKVQRQPRLTYDGPTCATHQSECGRCNEGYEEVYGVCIPKNVFTPTLIGKVDSNPFQSTEENQEATSSFVIPTIVGIIIAVFAIAFIWKALLPRVKQIGIRFGVEEEETGLTHGSHTCDRNPTAPPPPLEEYFPPPPIYLPPLACGSEPACCTSQLPRNYQERNQMVQAVPFDYGHGGAFNVDLGDIEFQDPVEIEGIENVTPPIPPVTNATEHPQPVDVDIADEEEPSVNLSQEALVPLVPLNSPLSQPTPPPQESSFPDQQANDPVQAAVSFRVYFQVEVGNLEFMNPDPPSGSPSQPPVLVASAPTSPGRVDDSYTSLQFRNDDTFLTSDSSIDSGNGSASNDNSFEVPTAQSQSIGVDFSDTEEHSLYGSD